MNIKEQNKALSNLKKEYKDTLDALDDILFDAVETLGYEIDDDIAGDWVHEYLNGGIAVKHLRKRILEDKNR